MAISKFSIINDALSNTDNNLAVAADLTLPAHDPNAAAGTTASFEWDRASRAYDRELPLLLERHPWSFAITTEALELADDDDNPSNRFAYAYERPYFALWLQKVESPGGGVIPYELIGNYICMDTNGEDTDAPIATFIQTPLTMDSLSNLFVEVLRVKVEVGILRAVNEDYSEATRRDSTVEQLLLPLVRTRTDQQMPVRRAFRSTMLERRRSGGGPRAL